MKRLRALLLSVALAALLMLMLWWVAPAGAQGPGLVSGAGLVWTKQAGPNGDCSISDVSFTGDNGVVLCDNEPGANLNDVHAVASNWPPESGGMVFDVFFEYVGTRDSGATFFHRVTGSPHTIAEVLIGQSVSLRVCLFEDVGNAPADCDYIYDYPQNYFGGSSGGVTLGITAPSHDAGGRATITNVMIWTPYGPTPTPGPGDFQGWIGPAYTCVLTTTLNITDTSGLNFTHTVQYERPANFLRNADFEEPEGNKARYWTPVVNGTGNLDVPNHYLITLNPDTGKQDRVLVDIQEYGYWQGNWLGGKQFTALFGAEANGSGVSILYDSITVATSVYDTLTYFVPFSGTQAVGGGAPFFRIEFPGLNGQTWVDNAFLYPWDEETETVLCDPELFDPYDQEIDGTSGLQDAMLVGGVPAPIAGAGSVCYVCFTPSQIGANAVSLWIAWLGCVLRNMFSCSLRVWLLALGNWTFGVIQWLSALALWIPAEVQKGATWYMRDVVPGLAANVTVVQDGGSNLADVIIAFLALLATLISSLASLTVSVVEFLLSFVQMLQGAINPEPYEFGLDETAPGMSGAGATDAKRLWLFLIGFAVLDQLIMQYPEITALLMVVTGAAVLGVVYWSFRWWRDFINF